MFAPDFTLPAKIFQSFTEMAVANITNSIKIAGDMANMGLQSANNIIEKTAAPQAAKSAEAPFPFTAFNYIPNLFKEEEQPVNPFMPFNPFEAFQQKNSNNSLFPMMDFSAMQGAQQPFGSMSPFSAFAHLQPMMEQFKGASGGSNLKGAMVFFDIPMDRFKFDNLPWASFPGLSLK